MSISRRRNYRFHRSRLMALIWATRDLDTIVVANPPPFPNHECREAFKKGLIAGYRTQLAELRDSYYRQTRCP
jgi:hypothetical protein